MSKCFQVNATLSLSEQLYADAKRHQCNKQLVTNTMCVIHLDMTWTDRVALRLNNAMGTDNHKLQ